MGKETTMSDEKSLFIEPNAFAEWIQYKDLNGRQPFCSYQSERDLRKLSEALDRPLTLEELRLLVGEEKEMSQTCKKGGKFTPVWWVFISDELVELVKKHESIAKALSELGERVVENGSYFVLKSVFDEPIPVSGAPWFRNHKRDVTHRAYPNQSPMAALMTQIEKRKDIRNKWPMSKRQIEGIRERIRQRSAERQREDREDADTRAENWAESLLDDMLGEQNEPKLRIKHAEPKTGGGVNKRQAS